MEENFKTHTSTIIKIVVFGPECSGKTTLATQLAHYFQTPLVVTDDFAQKQQSLLNVSEEQLLNNVQKQSLLETEMLAQAEQLLLYDSHILSLKIILDKEFEMSSSSLNDMMRSQHYDLFLLTDIDVPFSADPV
jgi:nicotinamide riboside kinase